MTAHIVDSPAAPVEPIVAAPTKTASEENFPVGSWLLPRALRPHVAAFYRFARAADDIGDSPDLPQEAKVAGLRQMGTALDRGGDDRVDPIRHSAAVTGVGLEECRDLLVAFGRDAVNQSCDSWDDLLDYCRYSAHPVGRYLLRLHGESEDTLEPGDALCAAFQVLNHLQDCGDDWRALSRLYVPGSWIAAAGGIALFFDPKEAARRRPVLDRCLDGVDRLLEVAAELPHRVESRGLRAETAVMLSLADRLTRRLRAGDPLEARVALSKGDFARALLPGLAVLAGREPKRVPDTRRVADSVMRARSSFGAGMRILGPDRRRAMYALYAFCRSVDDIADAPAPVAEKRAQLDDWSRALDRLYAGRSADALTRELAHAVRAYDLPRDEFELVLDGMRTDAAPSVRLADRAALAAYARCVAGAVGVLSCRIFGVPDEATKSFAIYLGETLQVTNILRDIDEDAAIDRLYLPLDLLADAGLDTSGSAAEIVADARVERACLVLAAEAAERYRRLPALLPAGHGPALRSALIMQLGYERILRKLETRGWRERSVRPRLSKRERLATLLAAFSR